MKKIVFLTLDITLIGGVERMLSTLLPYLQNHGQYDIEVLSFFKGNNAKSFNFDRIKIKYLSNRPFDLSTYPQKLKSYFTLIISLFSIKRDKNVIYISTFPNISIFFLLFKGGHNLIITEHAQFDAHGGFVSLLRKTLYKKAKAIVVLTQSQYEIFKRFIRNDKLFIIPNPIISNVKALDNHEPIIITVGRLVPEKCFEFFILVVKEIKKSVPNISAFIVGSGPEFGKLNSLIVKHHLDENITIIQNETDVSKFIIKSRVFVVTSKSESFGLAMLESLSLGIPVVAFDAGEGPRSLIIDNLNGYLVPFADLDALQKQILYVLSLNDADWRIISNNSIKSTSLYKVDNVFQKWQTLFK